ncbi:MAG: DinB family protein [Armatimonadetes bacterium]|nr:MAG: DinB family protein [Armatimonadota bacterium]
MAPSPVLVQLFDQILEGKDIPTAEGVLRVKREDAEAELPPLPYSLLVNLAHAVHWQDLWLNQLEGKPNPPIQEVWRTDWRRPDASEYPALRKRFVEGLRRARALAGEEFASHRCESDEKAAEVLLRIAIHASYHIGQMNLLKRALRNTRKA